MMERLIKQEQDFEYQFCSECVFYGEPNGCNAFNGACESYYYFTEAAERLRKYEDAEEAGLLVRLPCKVGDTLYTNQMVQGWYLRKENRPFPVSVCFIGINGEDNFFNVDYKCGHMLEFKFSDIGKTIFFTREEAVANRI